MKNFLSIGLKQIARKNFNPSKNQTDVGVNLFFLSPQQPLSITALIFRNAGLEMTIHQKQQVMPPSFY